MSNDTESSVEFGDLPPSTMSEHANWQSVAEALRRAPLRWAKIDGERARSPQASRNLAQRIKRGTSVAFAPPGAFEAVTRGTDVWARFVGEQS